MYDRIATMYPLKKDCIEKIVSSLDSLQKRSIVDAFECSADMIKFHANNPQHNILIGRIVDGPHVSETRGNYYLQIVGYEGIDSKSLSGKLVEALKEFILEF